MTKLTVVRSQLEIAVRIAEVKENDFFGTKINDLVTQLPFVTAKQFLKDDVTEADFNATAALDADVQHVAIHYLDFAIGKAVDHRGLSAVRSVDHYQSWLWLLLPDAEFATFENAGYDVYGVPQLKAAAQLLGADAIWKHAELKHPELVRMAAGLPCEEDCEQGCNS